MAICYACIEYIAICYACIHSYLLRVYMNICSRVYEYLGVNTRAYVLNNLLRKCYNAKKIQRDIRHYTLITCANVCI